MAPMSPVNQRRNVKTGIGRRGTACRSGARSGYRGREIRGLPRPRHEERGRGSDRPRPIRGLGDETSPGNNSRCFAMPVAQDLQGLLHPGITARVTEIFPRQTHLRNKCLA